LGTFLVQDDTTVSELQVSSYLGTPLNDETYAGQKDLAKEEEGVKTNEDPSYKYFYEQSMRKLGDFFKYNSVVDMTFQNKKLEFLEWEFKLKLTEYGNIET
jgi:hypothetical protein